MVKITILKTRKKVLVKNDGKQTTVLKIVRIGVLSAFIVMVPLRVTTIFVVFEDIILTTRNS